MVAISHTDYWAHEMWPVHTVMCRDTQRDTHTGFGKQYNKENRKYFINNFIWIICQNDIADSILG